MNTEKFNAQELCSRKLWQLLNAGTGDGVNDSELDEVVAELVKRRHYLEKIQEMGKLGDITEA